MRITALIVMTLAAAIILAGCSTPEEIASASGNIIVAEPSPGDTIASPVTLRGRARVFEANVNYRIRGEDDRELAFGFTTATEAGPAFGDFEEQVEFEIPPDMRRGMVEIFSISAKTGEEEDMVRIPVRFE